MADVDAMVALTKKYNEGFFYPVFIIIVIALQFPLHHALEDEWQRQAYEDDWEMGNKGFENSKVLAEDTSTRHYVWSCRPDVCYGSWPN